MEAEGNGYQIAKIARFAFAEVGNWGNKSMNQNINMGVPENLEKFYEQFGSSRFRLQSEMAQERGRRLLELYYRSIDFIYKTITTIGIIAGFGFTALGYVKNITLFVVGELFLFSAIAFGIWATQKIYLKEIENLEGLFSKIRVNFSKYVTLFESKLKKATDDKTLTTEDIKELQEKDRELLKILQESPETEKDKQEMDLFPRIVWTIFSLFVVGVLPLLASFLLTCNL